MVTRTGFRNHGHGVDLLSKAENISFKVKAKDFHAVLKDISRPRRRTYIPDKSNKINSKKQMVCDGELLNNMPLPEFLHKGFF